MPPVIIAVAAVAAYSVGAFYVAAALFVASMAMAADVDMPDYDNDSVNPLASQEITTQTRHPKNIVRQLFRRILHPCTLLQRLRGSFSNIPGFSETFFPY